MNKALLLAAAAGTFLISSAPPPGRPIAEGVGYPPCSQSLRDRCIQLHERGVAAPDNLAINEGDGPGDDENGPGDRYAEGPPPRPIMPHGMMRHGMSGEAPEMDSVVGAPPPEPGMRMAMNDYPPCAGGVEDRCIQRTVLIRQHQRMLRIGERG